YTPTEYRQRTDKHRKQPPTGDRTDTTPGTGHRGGSPRRDHPTGPDNPNLIAAQHLAPLTAAIDNGWPVFVPQAYTPWEFCKNDRLTVQGLACVRALEDRPSNTPDPHTIAQTCGILLTPCGARVLVTLG
ncbi:MAG: hypothetical protein QG671_120, partial [Actinomycetota bacterium]|nr:hypothetical protein [Actinomycetota bacterium]